MKSAATPPPDNAAQYSRHTSSTATLGCAATRPPTTPSPDLANCSSAPVAQPLLAVQSIPTPPSRNLANRQSQINYIYDNLSMILTLIVTFYRRNLPHWH